MASDVRASARPSPFRQVGRYELLCEIAAGGMASVWLGRTRGVAGFERLAAVKCCHPQFRSDAEFVAMFLDEARLAGRIHHPHVVATLDIGDGDPLYMVMEYVDGGTLAALIKAARVASERRMPFDVGLRIVTDSLLGLHAAHELEGPGG